MQVTGPHTNNAFIANKTTCLQNLTAIKTKQILPNGKDGNQIKGLNITFEIHMPKKMDK